MVEGHIDMCCFCFHYTVPRIFDEICAGDYRYVQNLVKMGYKLKFQFDLPKGIWGNYSGKADGKIHSCYKDN